MNDTDIDRQRGLADPVRARKVVVLHDDGPMAGELELLLALIEPQDITEVHRIAIDPDDPGSVRAALDRVLADHTRSRPDFAIIACDRVRRGLPVRGLIAPEVLARVAHLPVPVATLSGPHSSPIDAAAWRPFADVDDLDQYIMDLLAGELRLAELRRLEAIAGLFMHPDTLPPDVSDDDAI